MKKIIYILPLLFIILVTSCEVEESQSSYPRTIEARNAFGYVEKGISQSINLLDLMTKVSYYGEAADDKKEGIKNHFFASYTITSTANSWLLKDDYQEFIFTHNNKPINESGATWTAKITVKLWDGSFKTSVVDKNYKVESIGNKNWKISTLDFSFYGYYENGFITSTNLDVTGIDAYEKSGSIYNFKVEKGSGITNVNTTKLTYDILNPTIYSTNNNNIGLVLLSGEIEVVIDEQKDKINAEIVTSNDYPKVKITYKGITETY